MVTGPATDRGVVHVPTRQIKDPMTKEMIQEAKDNDTKAAMFYAAFFPPRPAKDMTPQNPNYPAPKWMYALVTDEQIEQAITKMKPYKATRPVTIPNCVFKHMNKLLISHLGPIYRATDTMKWYPDNWKLTNTPVIRKPGKSDYTVPGAWRPIVLSSRHARLLNSSKTDDLVSHCEKLGILPTMHFRGRPGRLTMDSVHLLVQTIKDAWRQGMVVSVLFLERRHQNANTQHMHDGHPQGTCGMDGEAHEWKKDYTDLRRLPIRTVQCG
jgi:hypothetical protein